MEANPLGWQAVHFHFSKLSPSHRRESTVRIALAGLQDLVRSHDGRTFVLFNYDIVLLVRGPLVTVVNDAIDSTRALFRDDPLSKRPEAFSTWYDLSIGNNRLQTAIRKLVVEKARAQNAQTTKGGDFVEIEPLDPDRLFKLQQALTGIDLSAYVRRQRYAPSFMTGRRNRCSTKSMSISPISRSRSCRTLIWSAIAGFFNT